MDEVNTYTGPAAFSVVPIRLGFFIDKKTALN